MTYNNALVAEAMKYYGQKEIPGPKLHNWWITEFIKYVREDLLDDETPWCSAFMNYVAGQCGLERTDTLVARDWLKVGVPVKEPILGDVVIFWRVSPDSWKGHVGIYTPRIDSKNIWCLGGNQGNQVNISPYRKYRVLGYRRLRLA